MLAQKNRFHGHASLKYVFRRGAVSRSRLFVVRAVPNARRHHSRCSVVVSKKVLKSAVGRNLIRRRLYHSIHPDIDQLSTAYDIVIVVCSAEVATMPYHALTSQLATQLSEVGVVRDIAQTE